MRFPDGIDAQPDVLAQSAKAVAEALAPLSAPPAGAVIGLVGIGASEHVARSAAQAWRALGLRAFGMPAAELLLSGAEVADVYVGLSESGRSSETLAALEPRTGRRVAVTNFADSPLAELCDETVALDSGPDSPVYTTGYTATLQAVGMLGEHWAGSSSDWAAVPALVAKVIADARPVVDTLVEAFDQARIVDVVGSAAAAATAGEGALLLREAARLHTAAHETRNYLHGPMEPVDERTACVIVGDRREVQLAADVSALGSPTLLLTTRTDVEPRPGLTVLELPEAPSPLAAAILQIVPIQLLGWAVAARRGLRADGFRYEQTDTKVK